MNVDEIRKCFPSLDEKVYGRPLVYFDNAATSLRPAKVIDTYRELSVHANANIHRAVHFLAGKATDAYEDARKYAAEFINAESSEEIIFTSGTTASINLAAFSFGEAFVREGDEVIVSQAEHHSDIVPWQLMCKRKKAVLKVLPVDDCGKIMLSELERLCSVKTKILAVTHISNVLGLVNPVREIIEICHSRYIPVLVDGAQGIVHSGVDVKSLDCDFYAFSGHKIYAATGTGVLYGKKKWLDAMPPFLSGGEMVGTVTFEDTTFAPLPLKFEAGTQNFTGAATLKPALETARSMRCREISENEKRVKEYLYGKLLSFNGLHLFGKSADPEEKISLFSFAVEGVHHEDLALILDKMGIAVRSGQMCAEPLMDRFGVTGMLRISLAPYNTMEEAEYFAACLERAVKMLKN